MQAAHHQQASARTSPAVARECSTVVQVLQLDEVQRGFPELQQQMLIVISPLLQRQVQRLCKRVPEVSCPGVHCADPEPVCPLIEQLMAEADSGGLAENALINAIDYELVAACGAVWMLAEALEALELCVHCGCRQDDYAVIP